MRQSWGQRMCEVIIPGGLLVCLEFPLYKDPAIPGPPYGVSESVYWDVLARGGLGILQSDRAVQYEDDQGSFIRALRIKPQRSHLAGMGTDMISIWRRKSKTENE